MTQQTPLHPGNVAMAPRRDPRTRRRPRATTYAIVFAVPLLIAGLILGALHSFLSRVNETVGPVSAARIQDRQGELYGPALVYRPFVYKLERYRLKQPDILIIGSSRAMPFAGEVFTGSMINAGGAANTLEQTIAFAREAIAIHKPKAILITLDFWWFNPNRDDEIDATGNMSDEVDLSLTQLMAPLNWIADGSLRLSSLFEGIVPFRSLPPGIGAFAKFGGRGWDVYGRYDYGTLLDGGMASDDRQFKKTLKRLQSAKKSSKLNVRVGPSADSIAALASLLSELEAQSIDVTLVLPPMAGPVLQAIEKNGDNRLLPLWRDAMNRLGARLFDFTDPAAIGSGDCEFVDGFHGGEVTYLRILDAIAGFGGSVFARSIDRDMTTSLIASNAGHARIAELRPSDIPTEIDFLDLGCDKTR